MQFEGEHKVIPLKGIERASADNIVEDGAMNEVIGMIYRNGSLVPYAPTDTGLNQANDITMIRVHHTSTGDNIILVRKGNTLLNESVGTTISYMPYDRFIRNGYCVKGYITSIEEDDSSGIEVYNVIDIVFIGNRMDICTESGIFHYIWKNNAYKREHNFDTVETLYLPSVELKVRTGIYNGDKVYAAARYVRHTSPYDGADDATKHAMIEASTDFVRSENNIGSNTMALVKAIRNAGGITGYVLVAAAYKIKNADKTSYIPCTPVMLMGAPEIQNKDNKFRKYSLPVLATLLSDTVDKPINKSFMFDLCNYDADFNTTISSSSVWPLSELRFRSGSGSNYYSKSFDSQEKSYNDLLNLKENAAPLEGDGENYASISLLESDDAKTYLRTKGSHYVEGYVTVPTTEYYRFPESGKKTIKTPCLFGCKYTAFNHPSATGTNNDDIEHRGYIISQGTGNVLSFKINSDIEDRYRDSIDELVIFMSPIVMPYKYSEDVIEMKSTLEKKTDKYDAFFFDGETCAGNYKVRYLGCGGGFFPTMKSDEEIRDELKNVSGLYPVKNIPFSEIKKSDGWIDINLSGKLNSDTLQQNTEAMLKLSDLQNIDIYKGNIFGYNGRLHIFNYLKSTIQRLNYSTIKYYGNDGQYPVSEKDTIYHYAIEVKDKNDSLIITEFDSTNPAINPIVSYPDTGIQSIRIVKRYQKGNTYYAGEKIFDSVSNIANGLSYGYINTNLNPINIECKIVGIREYNSFVSEEKIMPDSETYGFNEIRVSDTYSVNMPNENIYRVGNGQIIALARFSMGLSQDNYGRFPLLVFSTDGIYTLDVNTTGDGAYTSQSPLSRIVCTNKNSICEIDSAVIFASAYGLMVVTTDGVKPLAQHINGSPNNIPTNGNGLSVYKSAITNEKLVKLEQDISTEDFIEYIQAQNTYIRYLNTINSIVIYNPTISYSYILELGNYVCTKIEQQIMLDDNDYPQQTFYIKPNNSVTGYIKIDDTKTSVSKMIESIDTDKLLRGYLESDIKEQLDASVLDAQTSLSTIQNKIAELILSKEAYENVDDSDLGTDRNALIDGVEQEIVEMTNQQMEISTRLSDLLAAQKVDFGSLTLNAEDELKLEKVGLQSVGLQMQKEIDGDIDFSSLRNSLKQDVVCEEVGTLNTELLSKMLPVGTTKLTLEKNGLWTYGKTTISDIVLNGIGLIPRTEQITGMTYIIENENSNYTSVKFDYYTGKENVPCLIQTRPIKVDTMNHKTAYRVVLRGAFEKADNDIVVKSIFTGAKFTITDYRKLSMFCQGKNTLIYYKYKETIGEETKVVRQWRDSNGDIIKLSDIGLEQKSYILDDDVVQISPSVNYAGLYVFGSLDAEHWTLIGAKEKLLSYNRFHDIGCETHRVSMKYLMVVFCGNLNTDCHIDGFEITTKTKYNNKLK